MFGNVRKHGAGIYVLDSISCLQVEASVPNVAIVHLIDYDVFVLSVYRPPSYSFQDSANLLEFLGNFSQNRELVILGDFNLPSLKWPIELNSFSERSASVDSLFLDLFVECGLTQWVHFSTFFPSGNTLDLVLTSEDDRVASVSSCAPLPGCQHLPVFVGVVFQLSPQSGTQHIVKRDWFRSDFLSISRELGDIEWEFLFTNLSVNDCYSVFLEILTELIEMYVPVKPENPSPKWLSSPPRALMRDRSRAWQLYKDRRCSLGRNHPIVQNCLEDFQNINYRYRNFSQMKQSRYERKLVSILKDAPKAFHGYIRGRKKGCPTVGPLRLNDGNLTADCASMCEEFASAFCSVFVNVDPVDPMPDQYCSEQMNALQVTYDAVVGKLESLKSSSSAGEDNIHPLLLKSCAETLALPLSLIFRLSLSTGSLPDDWKRSKVVPIFKSGSKSSPLNYRPVSLTSVPCKVLERLLVEHIMDFINENGLFSQNQFGFRSGHSAEDQLLLIYSDVVKQVDIGNIVDMLFLDYSKAFDVVNHRLLLRKLSSLGFSRQMIGWIEGFLCGRRMSVSVGGESSRFVDVSSGVPQGSVLGPVLFLIYVNCIAEGLKCKWYAYADDFKLYIQYPKGQDQDNSTVLQSDLSLIDSRSISWNLNLNPAKCVVVRFGGGAYQEAGSGYFVGNQELRLVEFHRDLGIVVDHTLKFHRHINTLVCKASGLANQLLRATICRDGDFMVALFVSHIRPLLDYCSTVWNLGYLGDLRKLESVQRRWTKQVAGLSEQPYESRLRHLGLFSVEGRLLRADLIKLWKAFHADIDVGLSGIFERQGHSSTRGHQFKLSIPLCHSDLRRKFFNVRRVIVWNGLPPDVVGAESLERFKASLDGLLADLFYAPCF